MNANTRFEIRAETFYLMTGFTAPGKDRAAAEGDVERYTEEWDRWLRNYGWCVNMVIKAVEKVG